MQLSLCINIDHLIDKISFMKIQKKFDWSKENCKQFSKIRDRKIGRKLTQNYNSIRIFIRHHSNSTKKFKIIKIAQNTFVNFTANLNLFSPKD